jgi:hypothetical protein
MSQGDYIGIVVFRCSLHISPQRPSTFEEHTFLMEKFVRALLQPLVGGNLQCVLTGIMVSSSILFQMTKRVTMSQGDDIGL